MESHDLYNAIVIAYNDKEPAERCPILEMCLALISDIDLDNFNNLCDFLQNDLSSKKWNNLQPYIQKFKDAHYFLFVEKTFDAVIKGNDEQIKYIATNYYQINSKKNRRSRINTNKDKIIQIIENVTNIRQLFSVEYAEQSGYALYPKWKSSHVLFNWKSHSMDGINCIEQLIKEKITTEKITRQDLYKLCSESSKINDFEMFIIASYYGFIHNDDYIDILKRTGLNNYLPIKWIPEKIYFFYSDVLHILNK